MRINLRLGCFPRYITVLKRAVEVLLRRLFICASERLLTRRGLPQRRSLLILHIAEADLIARPTPKTKSELPILIQLDITCLAQPGHHILVVLSHEHNVRVETRMKLFDGVGRARSFVLVRFLVAGFLLLLAHFAQDFLDLLAL